MNVAALDRTACANCGRGLTGPYCGACGQKAASPNPTIGDVVHELTHELLHVDGKIFRTIRLLIAAPGVLTAEQFAGRRASYVSPIRLYLICSVLFFAVSALVPDVRMRVTVGARTSSGLSLQNDAERQSSPDRLRQLGFESDDQLEAATNEAIAHWAPRVMFVLVPLFAAMIHLTVRRSGRNYPQQLYFALHVHAAWFLCLAIAMAARLVPWPIVGRTATVVALVAMLAYLALALRRAYAITLTRALGRALVVGVSYSVVLILALAAIALPAVLLHR